ncbi:hypothetical protein BaRGS_00007753 [Batillaria attramentaria]|uniref:Uncharacterized protein n=1 Tax=Batillaria attramentaria TaxID=370345 RepID=A0ABD0LN25_9CAEN
MSRMPANHLPQRWNILALLALRPWRGENNSTGASILFTTSTSGISVLSGAVCWRRAAMKSNPRHHMVPAEDKGMDMKLCQRTVEQGMTQNIWKRQELSGGQR